MHIPLFTQESALLRSFNSDRSEQTSFLPSQDVSRGEIDTYSKSVKL